MLQRFFFGKFQTQLVLSLFFKICSWVHSRYSWKKRCFDQETQLTFILIIFHVSIMQHILLKAPDNREVCSLSNNFLCGGNVSGVVTLPKGPWGSNALVKINYSKNIRAAWNIQTNIWCIDVVRVHLQEWINLCFKGSFPQLWRTIRTILRYSKLPSWLLQNFVFTVSSYSICYLSC